MHRAATVPTSYADVAGLQANGNSALYLQSLPARTCSPLIPSGEIIRNLFPEKAHCCCRRKWLTIAYIHESQDLGIITSASPILVLK